MGKPLVGSSFPGGIWKSRIKPLMSNRSSSVAGGFPKGAEAVMMLILKFGSKKDVLVPNTQDCYFHRA